MMTNTEKAIQESRELLKKFFDTADVDTLVTIKQAIQALQEKAERDKGCEYCRNVEHVNGHYRNFYKAFPHDNDDKVFTTLDYADLSIAHDKKSGWVLHYESENGDKMFDIKINACPMCGRKLNSNATGSL